MAAPEQAGPVRRNPDYRAAFINATEMYLRSIYEMEEESGVAPRRSSLCRRLGISRSAVSQHVGRLVQHGLATLSPQQRILLTASGRAAATVVTRKHRLAECLLVEIVGLDWEAAHVEASRWQHVLGEAVERKLLGILDDPGTTPFGDPVPGLDELDPSRGPCGFVAGPFPSAADFDAGADAGGSGSGRVRVRRILGPLQEDRPALRLLRSAGVLPGAVVDVRGHGRAGLRIVSSRGDVVLDAATARWIVVERADTA